MEALIQEMLDGRILLAEAVAEFEKIYIEKALAQNGDHLMRTADALGIHRNTLSSRLSAYKDTEPAKTGVARSGKHASANSKKRTQTKKLKARAAGSSR